MSRRCQLCALRHTIGSPLLLATIMLFRPRRLNSTARKHRGMRSIALQKNSSTIAPSANPIVTEGRRAFAERLEAVLTASLLAFTHKERAQAWTRLSSKRRPVVAGGNRRTRDQVSAAFPPPETVGRATFRGGGGRVVLGVNAHPSVLYASNHPKSWGHPFRMALPRRPAITFQGLRPDHVTAHGLSHDPLRK